MPNCEALSRPTLLDRPPRRSAHHWTVRRRHQAPAFQHGAGGHVTEVACPVINGDVCTLRDRWERQRLNFIRTPFPLSLSTSLPGAHFTAPLRLSPSCCIATTIQRLLAYSLSTSHTAGHAHLHTHARTHLFNFGARFKLDSSSTRSQTNS